MILFVDETGATLNLSHRLETLGVATSRLTGPQATDWLASVEAREADAVEAILIAPGPAQEALVTSLRVRGRAPVIAVTGETGIERRLAIFAAGADDLLSPMTHARELLARVAAISRRKSASAVDPSATTWNEDIVIFNDGRDPIAGGSPLNLPRRERRILECLARHRGAWLSKSQVFNEVYGLFNDNVDETVIESHVCRLRKRLAQRLGYVPISSQRHLGYRLDNGAATGGTKTVADAAKPLRPTDTSSEAVATAQAR